jgi:signal peptidase I
VAERQPGSPEPADDRRNAPDARSSTSPSPALGDSWAATPEGVTDGLRRPPEPDAEPADEAASETPERTRPLPDPEPATVTTASRPEPERVEDGDTSAGEMTAGSGGGDAGERGSRDRREDRGGVMSFFRELPVLVVLAFALALLLKTFVVQAFYIPSGSMERTLMPGDRVLVEKVMYHPAHGDVIVFEDPHPGTQPDRGVIGGVLHWLSQGLGFSQPADEDFIKRVIGLPGDTVELRHGRLFVNGDRIAEPYLRGEPDLRDYGPKTVPPGSLFVLGDNRLNSDDSRFGLGFVPEDLVIGKAFVIIWPPSRVGWLH